MTPEEDLVKKHKRADWIIRAGIASAMTQAGKDRIEEINFYEGYTEPGYEGDLIATGNWNSITEWFDDHKRCEPVDSVPERVGNLLEKIDVEIEWSDEWTYCEGCNLLMRTSPDGYNWTPNWVRIDDNEVCISCLDHEEHFRSIEGEPTRCNTLNLEPKDFGYTKVDDYERGFHRGQDADPQLIANGMEAWGIIRFLFHLESKGQFDSRFALYVHNDELEEGITWDQYPSSPPKKGEEAITALQEYLTRSRTHGASVSGAMEASLLAGTRMAGELEGEGIRVIKVTPEGATAKLVSAKDFIEGRALDDD